MQPQVYFSFQRAKLLRKLITCNLQQEKYWKQERERKVPSQSGREKERETRGSCNSLASCGSMCNGQVRRKGRRRAPAKKRAWRGRGGGGGGGERWKRSAWLQVKWFTRSSRCLYSLCFNDACILTRVTCFHFACYFDAHATTRLSSYTFPCSSSSSSFSFTVSSNWLVFRVLLFFACRQQRRGRKWNTTHWVTRYIKLRISIRWKCDNCLSLSNRWLDPSKLLCIRRLGSLEMAHQW